MENKISVEIPYEDSRVVERLFYEWNSGRNNIAFLMKDDEINYEILRKYIETVDAKFTELEQLKRKIVAQYQPKDADYDYTFDFDNHAIIFERKE